ncbi:MAG: methyltransferase domain-containing protein [Thermomicrobiales bacterium]
MSQLTNSLRGPVRSLLSPLLRSDEPELLDEAGHDPAELAANLRDIRRVNHLLGGTSIMLRHLPRLLDTMPATTQPVTLLDLATGSADIPLAILRWAKQRRLAATIVASDASAAILAHAREQIVDHPEITLARYDARSVPLPDKQFDVVLCSLALHHFSPEEAMRVLQEMDRLARTGFILNDLRRGRLGYAAAWVASRLTTRNRLTRHDAPLSVRRAYTPAELDALLRRAGIDDAAISTHPWFRMAAVKTGTTNEA